MKEQIAEILKQLADLNNDGQLDFRDLIIALAKILSMFKTKPENEEEKNG